jgi:Ca2+:H+ antiporter
VVEHCPKPSSHTAWINLLLVFVPLGIVAGEQEWGAPWVFTLNFLAIIPLAAVLSFATEEIAGRLGETLGGLVNATFGNAVELIVSIVALRAGEIEVVQASMLGSILSNLLLVLGMCFFLGGIYNMRGPDGNGTEQSFSTATAQTTCSLMTLASASMILPAALYGVLSKADEDNKQASILVLSRGTSIILLFLYVLYLYFALRTHKKLFEPEAQVNGSEDEHEPLLGPWSAGLVLVVTTLIISVCADYMVDSIDALVATGKISKTFIGLILIPIVGNAAEHVTACVVAVKDKMDLAMGVAIGSSIQIALLVTPALVMLGWAIGQPMTLHFETCKFGPKCRRVKSLIWPSRDYRVCALRSRRHVHRPRRQIQLPRGCYGMSIPHPASAQYLTMLCSAPRPLHDHRPRLLGQPNGRPRQGLISSALTPSQHPQYFSYHHNKPQPGDFL